MLGLSSLRKLLLGAGGGARRDALAEDAHRHAFSDYLPWNAYDGTSRIYHNADDSVGYLWECTPPNFFSDRHITMLESLVRLDLKPGSVLQLILHADDYIEPAVDLYESLRTRDDALIREGMNTYRAWALDKARNGHRDLAGVPFRRFRLFVALKTSESLHRDDLEVVEEGQRGAGLGPRRMVPEDLLDWARRLFNDKASANNRLYHGNIPIRKQIIRADSDVEFDKREAFMGGRYWRCMTPHQMPKKTTLAKTANLSGGVMGMVQDAEQITTPFIWAVNVVFGDVKADINAKALMTCNQPGGSFSVELKKRQEEYIWALGEMEHAKFVRVIPLLWVSGRSSEQATAATARVKRVWEAQGYMMQEDRAILRPLWLFALPFGAYATKRNIRTLDRDFPVQSDAVPYLFPVQADFLGGGKPVISLVGRKGQLSGIDLFDEDATNYNFMVAAATGKGKSYLVNELVLSYFATGAAIRLVDIGYSYEKLAKVLRGRFMNFGAEKQCINPFFGIQEIEKEIENIGSIILQMAYASSNQRPSELEWSLIKAGGRFAYERDEGLMGVDHVEEFLNTYPKHDPNAEQYEGIDELRDTARILGYNLRDFTSEGVYGRFFNGQSTLDIASDPFVVLELEEIFGVTALFRVAASQIINRMTQDLYHSDRSGRRMIIFEEAWKYIKEGGDAGAIIAPVIEEGYRRARKYKGSFGVVLQSIVDCNRFKAVGDVIMGNSDWKFFLESPDFDKAAELKLIEPDNLAYLKTLRTSPGKYSEIFIDSPLGSGVGRLVTDPFRHFLYSSKAEDVHRVRELVAQGMDMEAALNTLVKTKDAA